MQMIDIGKLFSFFMALFLSLSPMGTGNNTEPVEKSTEESETEYIVDVDYDDYYAEDGDYVICSVEAITASLGYLVVPVKLDFEEGKNCAEIFVELLSEYGYTPQDSGTPQSQYYLSAVGGVDAASASVPEALNTFLTDNNIKVTNSAADADYLGEFDLSAASGWMYSVNGETPSVALCDYYPEAGDVIRLQFSLCYGADLAYHEDWGFTYGDLQIADRENATRIVALYGADACGEYVELLSDFSATQDEIDNFSAIPVN
ncbi:MAG: DUF4430 domain-containing protein [Clostridia bacterium]|nr:DUF4430 domain-containing protein [Clostridia bacterium]